MVCRRYQRLFNWSLNHTEVCHILLSLMRSCLRSVLVQIILHAHSLLWVWGVLMSANVRSDSYLVETHSGLRSIWSFLQVIVLRSSWLLVWTTCISMGLIKTSRLLLGARVALRARCMHTWSASVCLSSLICYLLRVWALNRWLSNSIGDPGALLRWGHFLLSIVRWHTR